MAENILQHHHTAIHQHPYSNHQPHQGNDVQADVRAGENPEQIHESKRENDGHRNGNGNNEGAAKLPQEEKEHTHGQNSPVDPGNPEVVQTLGNVFRLIPKNLYRQIPLQLWKLLDHLQFFLQQSGHGDHIGGGGLVYINVYGINAIEPGERSLFRICVLHLTHIGQRQETSLQGQVGNIVRGLEFTHASEAILFSSIHDVAAGYIDVIIAKGLVEAVEVNAIGLQ